MWQIHLPSERCTNKVRKSNWHRPTCSYMEDILRRQYWQPNGQQETYKGTLVTTRHYWITVQVSKQLSGGKYFAAEGGEVLSETLLMRYGYENIITTGLFNTDCSNWRKMKPTEKDGTSSRSSSRLLQKTRARMQQQCTSILQLMYKKC